MNTKVDDDSLYLKFEDVSENNKYDVAVIIEGRTSAHLPKNLSKIFKPFSYSS